jgi:hypothetical protein
MNQVKVLLRPGGKKDRRYVGITEFEVVGYAVTVGFSVVFNAVVLNYLLKHKIS